MMQTALKLLACGAALLLAYAITVLFLSL